MSCCFASKPTSSMRVRRRLSRRSSSMPSSSAFSSSSMAATPASIFMARSISSAAVSSGTLPISFRYMRTGSPVSMVTPASMSRLRAALRTLTRGRLRQLHVDGGLKLLLGNAFEQFFLVASPPHRPCRRQGLSETSVAEGVRGRYPRRRLRRRAPRRLHQNLLVIDQDFRLRFRDVLRLRFLSIRFVSSGLEPRDLPFPNRTRVRHPRMHCEAQKYSQTVYHNNNTRTANLVPAQSPFTSSPSVAGRLGASAPSE